MCKLDISSNLRGILDKYLADSVGKFDLESEVSFTCIEAVPKMEGAGNGAGV